MEWTTSLWSRLVRGKIPVPVWTLGANDPKTVYCRKFLSKIFDGTWIHVLLPNLVINDRWEVSEKSSRSGDKKLQLCGSRPSPHFHPHLADGARLKFLEVCRPLGLDLCGCTKFGPDRLPELFPKDWLPRNAMHKCGLCHHAVPVCLSVRHVRGLCQNE